MTLELYQFGDSPCCMKARLVLAEKNLPWTERFLKSWEFEHFQPEYLKLNPHGIVPTLVHDGKVFIQSNVIAEYFDDRFPESARLKPEDPALAALMRKWMFEEQDYLFNLIVVMSFNTMMKLRVEGYGLDRLKQWSLKHPDQARAQDYLDRLTAPVDEAADRAAQSKFRWHMERLEAELDAGGGPWICGEAFTLADVCVAPIMDRIEYLEREKLWAGLPAVARWFAAVKERPSYGVAVHPFDYRMWGPKKPVADHPYSE
jgi:glutathione S-transferase